MLPITIEPASPGDYAFVIRSWLATFADSREAAKLANDPALRFWGEVLPGESDREHPNTYYGLQRLLVNTILSRPTTVVLCAYVDGDTSTIAGWLCAEPMQGLLHYVCVKADCQRMQVAKRLLQAVGFSHDRKVTMTHLTDKIAYQLASDGKVPSGWRYRRESAFTGEQ